MPPKPESKKRNVDLTRDAVSQKSFDSTQSAKVLDAAGKVIREPGKARKEVVEELLTLLQNTVDDKLGGMGFVAKVDLLENHVYGIVAYAASLKEAAESIINSYPSEEQDVPLRELIELCDIVSEGANRANPYIDAIKNFSNDLDKIKTEMYTQIQTLFQEI